MHQVTVCEDQTPLRRNDGRPFTNLVSPFVGDDVSRHHRSAATQTVRFVLRQSCDQYTTGAFIKCTFVLRTESASMLSSDEERVRVQKELLLEDALLPPWFDSRA